MFTIMYWDGRLVIPALQRFYSSQQVAQEKLFPLILLQAKAGGIERRETIKNPRFPLILLQAKAGGFV